MFDINYATNGIKLTEHLYALIKVAYFQYFFRGGEFDNLLVDKHKKKNHQRE